MLAGTGCPNCARYVSLQCRWNHPVLPNLRTRWPADRFADSLTHYCIGQEHKLLQCIKRQHGAIRMMSTAAECRMLAHTNNLSSSMCWTTPVMAAPSLSCHAGTALGAEAAPGSAAVPRPQSGRLSTGRAATSAARTAAACDDSSENFSSKLWRTFLVRLGRPSTRDSNSSKLPKLSLAISLKGYRPERDGRLSTLGKERPACRLPPPVMHSKVANFCLLLLHHTQSTIPDVSLGATHMIEDNDAQLISSLSARRSHCHQLGNIHNRYSRHVSCDTCRGDV